MSSNLNTKNNNNSSIIPLVREEQPDIAVFMEVNDAGIKQLDSLKEIFPYSVFPSDNLGPVEIAVYTKQPLENTSVKFLENKKIKVSNIRTGPNVDSDHLPLIIDFAIPKKK